MKYQSKSHIVIWPMSENGDYLRWRWGYKSCVKGLSDGTLFVKKTRTGYTIYQYDAGDEFATPKSMWINERYDASSKGTNILNDIVPNNGFDYPNACTFEELKQFCPVEASEYNNLPLTPDKLNIICGSFYMLGQMDTVPRL